MKDFTGYSTIILEDNCNGEGEQFYEWVKENYPEIDVEFVKNTSGIGGGTYDENVNPVDDFLWDEYCNS